MGATSVEVVQVAVKVPPPIVADGQSPIALPLIRKLIVPVGALGAKPAPPRVAVKVAAVLRFTGPEDGEVKARVSVGVAFVTFCVIGEAVAGA